MSHQICKIGCVYQTLFRKSSHIYRSNFAQGYAKLPLYKQEGFCTSLCKLDPVYIREHLCGVQKITPICIGGVLRGVCVRCTKFFLCFQKTYIQENIGRVYLQHCFFKVDPFIMYPGKLHIFENTSARKSQEF